ncbi:hypothetical protein BC374_15205 [Ensifer sp. LC13]|nr:hypothetical protein BC362_08240 [Ensifer sp. LC14]OCP12183.1 hypothetical protein BC374_15205 [Ensifer sp. LC13]OCP33745.1 hypothetical protein BC364_14295 [Ensifer sp. LC499]
MSPHPLFSTAYYLDQRPDVVSSGMEPFKHFAKFGWREKTNPHPMVDVEYYLSQNPDLRNLDPLTHYAKFGWKRGLQISRSFDTAWYLQQNPDVAQSRIEPLMHYIRWGHQEGRLPMPLSDEEAAIGNGDGKLASVSEFDKSPAKEQDHGMLFNFGKWFNASEPKIRPEKLGHVAKDWPAVVARNVEVFRSHRERGPFSTAVCAPDESLLLTAKLASIGSDPSFNQGWIEQIGHATSGIGASYVEIFASLGLNPEVEYVKPTPTGTPILDNYNAMRIDALNRLRFNPGIASSEFEGPTFSVLMPVYRTPLVYLERAIASVLGQAYANWQLIIVDDFSEKPELAALLSYYEELDRRIKCISLPSNSGIASATNAALDAANGEYIVLLDHDDMMTSDALQCFAQEIIDDETIDLIYSDECKIDEHNIVVDIFSKPDWSPFLLFNCMYTGHLSAYKRELVARLGGFDSRFDFSQDYDLALRVAEQKPNVKHIERVLYGWRMIEGSAAMGGKPTARKTNIAALQAAMDRREYNGTAVALPMANRAKRSFPGAASLVSIVVPSDNVAHIRDTISSVLKKTTYENFEIIVVTNSEVVQLLERTIKNARIRFVRYDLQYNFSAKCNAGAESARGEYIVFFNDDVRVISSDWVDSLLEYLTLPGVGVVGPKLLYEDGRIQHAGMLTGVRRLVGTAFHTFPSMTPAHFNFAQSVREVSVICGACLAMPLSVFNEIGGFDEVNAPIAHSDVDLCFRVRDRGYHCIYTPHAELTHIGHLSIGKTKKKKEFKKDKADIYLMKRWGSLCARDPFFSRSMRDILYVDSQEPFNYFPAESEIESYSNDVLIFSHDLSGSGAPKIVLDMAKVLIESGSFVLVMSPEDGPMRERLRQIGAHVMVDPLALTQNANVTDLGKNFDVIIANTAVCWPIVSQFVKYSAVYWYFHETELVRQLAESRPQFRDALLHAKQIWCGSDASGQYIRNLGIHNYTILPYGVEAPPSTEATIRNSKTFVISVLATIEPRKGQDLAIQGYLALPTDVRQKCKLRLAGRVNSERFYQALVDFAKGHDDIEIEEALDFDTYLARLRETDVVICPSRDDTLPLVSLNALAEGKTLVCSRETGTSSFIVEGVSGFVLKANHPDVICEVLTNIIRSPDRLADIGREAALVYEQNFTELEFKRRLLSALGTVGAREGRAY